MKTERIDISTIASSGLAGPTSEPQLPQLPQLAISRLLQKILALIHCFRREDQPSLIPIGLVLSSAHSGAVQPISCSLSRQHTRQTRGQPYSRLRHNVVEAHMQTLPPQHQLLVPAG